MAYTDNAMRALLRSSTSCMVRRKSPRASMRKRPGPVGPSTSPSWAPPATARQTAQRQCRRHGHQRVAALGSRQSLYPRATSLSDNSTSQARARAT
ncbi:Pectin lyase-like superfamily protein [Zea mays]|uniref:Pectin lyase-like superfamily protein n=2 Tax=Zea mays TaxID=4577 RepID=A0A1D6LRC2_MAIZE|nr:Pectin lyase-like superfamily protein [Zea mays]AQK82009.1 Pectin lyase-like superfamily protein [Zea mays]AQK82013.1 Pectin lyase-like superfamily protein [Zea mays]AQK82029.1 Pectin lyase-like superfamily protein [Zea mays]AQK82043.1 Pectin lyase-like superfamily protein [Zea mays]